MAGPGSRLEKVGTIFTRVQGLLRSGAVKESDKPLWYDVFAAFPPRVPPKNETVSQEPVNILYREDLLRAKFYQEYGNPQPIDMQDNVTDSVSQKFIKEYYEIQKAKAVPSKEIFSRAVEALKAQGFQLKSREEIKKEQEETRERRKLEAEQRSETVTGQEVFGTRMTSRPEDAEDTLDESFLESDNRKM